MFDRGTIAEVCVPMRGKGEEEESNTFSTWGGCSEMKALKSYVKGLDCNAIPQFLIQVSETKETGSLSGEYTISLYEVLARVHGGNFPEK